jgi:toxin CcdB
MQPFSGIHRYGQSDVEGDGCILEMSNLAAVPVRILKVPVTSLSACRLEITQALDFLFEGF